MEREDITPDTADEDGRTPLSWAAGNGDGDVVKLLLEREDITPDTADKYGQTPLWWAAKNGHKDAVRMLLRWEGATLDATGKNSQRPLTWAPELLLEGASVSQDMPITNFTGRTVLRQTSKKQRSGAPKRQLENRRSVLQSASGDSSISLFQAEPSESSQLPSKKIQRS